MSSLPQVTQSLLDLVKANRLILGEYVGANYLDQEIKKAQGVLNLFSESHVTCRHCNGKCCRNDLKYRVSHMAAEFYMHDCEHCDDGTERNNAWLFVFYTGPGISQLVAMYPSMRSVEAFDFATSSVLGHYTIRRASWTGGPLPKYDQTEAVG